MQDYFSYIQNPFCYNEFIKICWRNFFLLLFTYLLVFLPLGLISMITSKFTSISRIPIELTFYRRFLLGIVFAPIVEEFLFRFLLVINRKNLIVFFGFCLTLITFYLLKKNFMFLLFTALFAAVSIVYLYYQKYFTFFENHYRVFFYLSAIIFGLVHITNFKGITLNNFMFTPLLVLPQVFGGTILGYVRVKYGFLYNVLFHAIVNIPILFMSSGI